VTYVPEEGTGEGRPRLVKLVRDRVGEFLDGRNNSVVYMQMPRDDVVPELRKKLLEECAEYLQNPSIQELADLYEVLMALAKLDLRVDWHEVLATAALKCAERGGLTNGAGMYVVTTQEHR
jgi:predicted house-cleaning noncanonical NTP pyrophosphatase (MazG superfamily)